MSATFSLHGKASIKAVSYLNRHRGADFASLEFRQEDGTSVNIFFDKMSAGELKELLANLPEEIVE
jgi:hypothetical protein